MNDDFTVAQKEAILLSNGWVRAWSKEWWFQNIVQTKYGVRKTTSCLTLDQAFASCLKRLEQAKLKRS